MREQRGIDISVVVPVYNEEESLPILISQIAQILESLKKSYEMIFVDDGSTDGSRKILKEMVSQYPQIHILGFRKNCGETAAGAAGLKEAKRRDRDHDRCRPSERSQGHSEIVRILERL